MIWKKLLIQRLVLALSLVFFYVSAFASEVLEDTELLGSAVQIQLIPKRSGGQLIGVDVYTLYKDGDVGTAFLSVKSFYRLQASEIIEDRDWYRLSGFASETTAEIENEYSTQRWSADSDVISSFDRMVRMIADDKTPTAQLRSIYRSLRFSPFKLEAGPEERKGEKVMKWFIGLQAHGQVTFQLTRSPKFGNKFSARFVQ